MSDDATVLVDDEVPVLDSLEALLAMNYRVLRAEGPEVALDFLTKREVALVISDQRMPGMVAPTGYHRLWHVQVRGILRAA